MAPAKQLELLTYSSETAFQNCRRLYYWRYERGVVPVGEDVETLWMGSTWHDMAEIRDRLVLEGVPRAIAVAWAHAWLAKSCPTRGADQRIRRSFLVLGEALDAYERRYSSDTPPRAGDTGGPGELGHQWIPDSDLEIVAVEREAIFPLVNPETDAKSRTFDNGIKMDAMARRRSDGKLWLVERKLLADLGDTDRLWTDFQLIRYSRQAPRVFGEPIEGAVYDVVIKPAIRLKEGKEEGEAEWAARVAEKIADSAAKLREKLAKKGLTPTPAEFEKDAARVRDLKTMQRVSVPPETDEEFRARLREKFDRPDAMARVPIEFDAETLGEVEEISWESSQQILDARRRGKWRKNLGHCYNHYGRECPYITLCRNRMQPTDPGVAGMYEDKPPHSEIGAKSAFDEVWEAHRAGLDPSAWMLTAEAAAEVVRGFFDDEPAAAPPRDILDTI